MLRRLIVAAAVPLLGVWLNVQGQDQTKNKPKSTDRDDAVIQQEGLARRFEDFKAALLRMAQRLERSANQSDRDRAVILKNAIKESSDKGISERFQSLIVALKRDQAASLNELKEAMSQSRMLADDIQAILAILLSDDRNEQLRRERERIEKLLKYLDQVIRDEKITRAQTEAGRMEKQGLAKAQNRVTEATKALARAMSKDGKSSSDAKAQSKADGKGNGKGKDGKGQGQGQGQGKSGDSQEQNQQAQRNSGLPPPQETPGRKQVEEAIGDQRQAEKKIDQQKNKEASEDQDKAIDKLEQVRKTLEEILKQLREEELQRLLAALEARCQKMLGMQKEVYEGTVRVDRSIAQNSDKKPSRAEEQRSLQLSDRELLIVREAEYCIKLLETEGAGVAFPEVFQQIRDDMVIVARRLGKADVGQVTQTIELDIIKTLEEMIEALKKAQSNSSGRGRGGQGKSNQNLIDLLAELKMIRAMQKRVNDRTVQYGKQYTGEQAGDPDIQKELANLAQRQQKIFEVTNNIARGKSEMRPGQ